MGTPGWEWDETLYAGAAPYYVTGRMPYPARVAAALAAELGLDGTGWLLDVGCGPGSLTLLLAPLFERAVGVDADPGMVAAARARARARDGAAAFRVMRAEEISRELGAFRLVTFAQSFHWMDQPAVARRVREVIEPGGACVLVHATTHQGVDGQRPLPYPRPPRREIAALVRRYLGPGRRAGRGIVPDDLSCDSDSAMAGAGFAGRRRLEVGGGEVVERDETEVVASVFSLSSSAPHLFGERRGKFEEELRALLRAASPAGRFSEERREIALDVWRP